MQGTRIKQEKSREQQYLEFNSTRALNELLANGFLYRHLLRQLIRTRREKISAPTKFKNTNGLQNF